MLKCLNVKMPERGFTLLEVIVAIFVVTIGVLSAATVTQQLITYTHHSASRLTAAYLAQEGIEIVRGIRDTNWLQEEDWQAGLDQTGYGWEADYTTTTFSGTTEDPCGDPGHNCKEYDEDNPLKISGGFYCYEGNIDTKFKRKITASPDGDTLKVSVSVKWEERGKEYGPVTAQENLYNWYPSP